MLIVRRVMNQSKLPLPSGVYVTGAALILTLTVILTTAGLSVTRPVTGAAQAFPHPSATLERLNIEERMVQVRMVRVVRQAEVAQSRLERRTLAKEMVDLRRGRTRRVPSLMFYARNDEKNWKAGRPMARANPRRGVTASGRRYTRNGAQGGPR